MKMITFFLTLGGLLGIASTGTAMTKEDKKTVEQLAVIRHNVQNLSESDNKRMMENNLEVLEQQNDSKIKEYMKETRPKMRDLEDEVTAQKKIIQKIENSNDQSEESARDLEALKQQAESAQRKLIKHQNMRIAQLYQRKLRTNKKTGKGPKANLSNLFNNL